MSNVVLFNPSDNAFVTFDWSDVLPSGVTLSSVAYTLPAPLSGVPGPISGTLSQIKLTGAVHGDIYQIAGAATLSNTENINRVFPVRAINS
jgi:hypothetical protein